MKYFVIAGEASGDMHAARLVHEIKRLYPESTFEGWGGDKLKEEGVHIYKHITDLAFMGFSQVLLNIRTILNNFKLVKKQIQKGNPDVVILVDYPGFNLRLAKWLKESNIRVVYYIAPQAWAWKENRVEKLKKYTDRLICILPFEKDFFAKHDLEVDYVGHPLLEQINRDRHEENIIALLPGSRKQEVESMLPSMLEVVDSYPDYTFKIGQSPNLEKAIYEPYLHHDRVELFVSGMASLLNQSKAALVTSGTATLETALYEVPQIVCYKSGPVSYQIAKRIIKVPYISLVNLIAEKEVVKELIQSGLNKENLIENLDLVLHENHHSIINEYKKIKTKLGGGTASKKAAEIITAYLKNSL